MSSSPPRSDAVCGVSFRCSYVVIIGRSIYRLMMVSLLGGCVRFGYDPLDLSNGAGGSAGSSTGGHAFGGTNNTATGSAQTGGSAAGGVGGGNDSATTTGGSSAVISGTTSVSSGTATGGSSVGGTYVAGGTNSGTAMGGSSVGGTYAAGGTNSGTAMGGSSMGGTYGAGGNDSGTATGGSSMGGAFTTGGSNSAYTLGGSSMGGAFATGGSYSASSIGGASGGAVNNSGGSDTGTNTGGYTAGAGGSSASATGGAGNGGTTGTGGAQSPPSVLSDTCRFTNIMIIEGASAADTLLAQSMAGALSTACGTAMSTRQVSQDAPGVLDTSGRPLIGPTELVVMCGGFVTQKAIVYLDQNDTPIYTSISAKPNHYTGFTRAGVQVFSIKTGNFTSSYDVGVIAVTYEPISQTFVVDVYGFNSTGTKAGVFYFANTLGPSLRTDANHYYVVEWTDLDGDQTASAGDRYVVLASG